LVLSRAQASTRTPTHIINQGIRLLYKANAFADARNSAGLTPLHYTCEKNYPTIAKVLLDCGASLSSIDPRGYTPLHFATRFGAFDMVRVLVKLGAQVNLRDHHLNTPLHLVSKFDIAAFLVKHGARVDLKNLSAQRADNKFKQVAQKATLKKHAERRAKLKCFPDDGRFCIEPKSWVKDEMSENCLLCGNKFTVFNRKHHCRRCGLLVCGDCSQKSFRCCNQYYNNIERACDGCFNILWHKEECKRQQLDQTDKLELTKQVVLMQKQQEQQNMRTNLANSNKANNNNNNNTPNSNNIQDDDILSRYTDTKFTENVAKTTKKTSRPLPKHYQEQLKRFKIDDKTKTKFDRSKMSKVRMLWLSYNNPYDDNAYAFYVFCFCLLLL